MKFRSRTMLVVLVGIGMFLAGLGASRAPALLAEAAQSDIEWAQKEAILRIGIDVNEEVKQAEFIRMLMRTYGVGQPIPNAKPPKGAEGHWAAGYYATAKAKGVIDCTCAIQPEGSVTHEQAAKFVLLAINSKANQQLLTLEEVQEWVRGEPGSALTYTEAATLLRKMDQFMRKQQLKEEV